MILIGLVVLLLYPNISEGEETGSKTSTSWKSVTKKHPIYQYIQADLDKFDLHLKTSSAMGSRDVILVMFRNKEGREVGGISIMFYNDNYVQYALLYCHDLINVRELNFPSYLPIERDKHWVIEKEGYRIKMHCNGLLVLDQTVSYFSPRTCDESTWYDQSEYWGQKVSSIKFSIGEKSVDTATYYYYIDSESDESKTKSKKMSATTIVIIILVILFIIVVGVYVYHVKRKDTTIRNNMREEPVCSAPPDDMQEEPVFPYQTLSNVSPPKYEESVRVYGEENVPSYEDVMGYGGGDGDGGDGGYDGGGGDGSGG